MTAPAVIVDILELEDTMKPTFTIDSTKTQVALAGAIPAAYFSLNGTGVKYYFQPADNILLLSLGIRLPYCFGYGAGPAAINFRWDGASGVTPDITNIVIPLENQEFSLAGSGSDGLYIPHYSLAKPAPGVKGRLGFFVSSGEISQVNVPAAFPDGTVLNAGIFLKVQHQLPMVT